MTKRILQVSVLVLAGLVFVASGVAYHYGKRRGYAQGFTAASSKPKDYYAPEDALATLVGLIGVDLVQTGTLTVDLSKWADGRVIMVETKIPGGHTYVVNHHDLSVDPIR